MEESERLQRFRQRLTECFSADDFYEAYAHASVEDEKFAARILQMLDDNRVTKCSLVDAFYYDYCELPPPFDMQFHGDMYLIYGTAESGEMISKWVTRYDLDVAK